MPHFLHLRTWKHRKGTHISPASRRLANVFFLWGMAMWVDSCLREYYNFLEGGQHPRACCHHVEGAFPMQRGPSCTLILWEILLRVYFCRMGIHICCGGTSYDDITHLYMPCRSTHRPPPPAGTCPIMRAVAAVAREDEPPQSNSRLFRNNCHSSVSGQYHSTGTEQLLVHE